MPAGPSPILEYVGLEATRRADLTPDELDVVDALNRRVGSEDSLAGTLRFLHRELGRIVPGDRTSVAFLEADGLRLVSHETIADYEPLSLKRGYGERLEGSSLAGVLDNGHVRLIHDLDAYAREHPDSRSTRVLTAEGVRGSITCPLVVDDRRVGVLFRSSRQAGAFERRHGELLLALLERLSQTIEKAYRIEQLAEANRRYAEVLGFVAHELRAPVAAMVDGTRILRGAFLGPLESAQDAKLAAMERQGTRLLEQMNEYMQLARLDAGDASPLDLHDDVDVAGELVDEAVASHAEEARARSMTIDVAREDDLPARRCDPGLVRVVLSNLVRNAIKYGDEGGRIEIGARRTSSPDALELAVWNEGPGFPESERHKLFRRFSRLSSPELRRRPGTGLGLYLSARIVALHGGTIDATSEPGAWARFAFRLP